MGIERSIEKKQRETGREVSQVCGGGGVFSASNH